MKNSLKIFISIIVVILIGIGIIFGFKLLNKKDNQKLMIENYDIIHETKFGGVSIKIAIDDFNKLGFKYGDSVNIKFSNGYELLDIPYYNGFYSDINEPLLIGYPDYNYIKVAINYGDDLWLTAKLSENDKATISLNKTNKYLDIQNASETKIDNIKKGLLENKNTNQDLKIENYDIVHETKFGGVYVKMTIDDFNKLGFKYGDSVNVKFSNGYELLDLPYYNGYYVDINEPLLVGYPGYDYIKVAVNYGDDLWLTAKLSENDKATISLNESEKYIDIQNARDIHYPDIQGDIPDIVFANFRNVTVGNIKPNILYRGASSIDNSHNRAPIVDKLIKEVKVKYIIDLSDNDDDIKGHLNKDNFNSPYFKSLYNKKKVIALSMNMQFKEHSFKNALVKGLKSITNNSGPYYIHCVEGKDRTGYVLMVIEALLGASYQEIIDDYMKTYDNYYDITEEKDIKRYQTIKEKNIDVMLHYMINDENNEKNLETITNYSKYAKEYLLSIGMKEKEINKLIKKLSK